MFVHHVFFWLKNPTSESDKTALITGLKTMQGIDLLTSTHIGVPAATNRPVIDTSYSISWLTVLESAEDEATYQIHPVHVAFVENCKHLWERVVIYDSIDPQ